MRSVYKDNDKDEDNDNDNVRSLKLKFSSFAAELRVTRLTSRIHGLCSGSTIDAAPTWVQAEIGSAETNETGQASLSSACTAFRPFW